MGYQWDFTCEPRLGKVICYSCRGLGHLQDPECMTQLEKIKPRSKAAAQIKQCLVEVKTQFEVANTKVEKVMSTHKKPNQYSELCCNRNNTKARLDVLVKVNNTI